MTMSILNVGDAVLYTKGYGGRPTSGNVSRVTKTQARVTLADGSEVGPFKREAWEGSHQRIVVGSRWNDSFVYPNTSEKEAELIARAEKKEAEAAEKKARQLKEVQDACGSLEGELPPMTKKVMPDGSRVYFASIPVKPCLRERKAGWEEVIIRCKDVEDFDWDNPRDPETGERNVGVKVEAHYTYINGSSSSFSSVSGSKFDSDEDAVWNAIRDRYHWR